MVIDILYLIFLLFAIYKGLSKGFIYSVFSFVGFFLGIICAVKFSHLASVYIHEWVSIDSKYIPFISFFAVFLVCVLLMKLIGKSLEKILEVAQLGIANKLAGIILWTIILTFVFSTMLWLVNQIHLISPEIKSSSKTYSYLEIIAPKIFSILGNIFPFIQNSFDELEKTFRAKTQVWEGVTLTPRLNEVLINDSA